MKRNAKPPRPCMIARMSVAVTGQITLSTQSTDARLKQPIMEAMRRCPYVVSRSMTKQHASCDRTACTIVDTLPQVTAAAAAAAATAQAVDKHTCTVKQSGTLNPPCPECRCLCCAKQRFIQARVMQYNKKVSYCQHLRIWCSDSSAAQTKALTRYSADPKGSCTWPLPLQFCGKPVSELSREQPPPQACKVQAIVKIQ